MSRSREVRFLNITIKRKWEDNSRVIFCHQHMPSDLFETGSGFVKSSTVEGLGRSFEVCNSSNELERSC